MRCECCNNILSDMDATARFASSDPKEPVRYVNMCGECRKTLPSSITIVMRSDFDEETKADYVEDTFDYESDDDGYEN